MTKKNPDDSVRDEQSGANENAPGSEDATQAVNAPDNDSLPDAEKTNDIAEKVIENEEHEHEEAEILTPAVEVSEHEEIHDFADIELPQVDYSGYSKHELVETLNLICLLYTS